MKSKIKKESKSQSSLSKEEKEILASYENGEWKSIGLNSKIVSSYQKAASSTLAKNKRINIRLNQLDLQSIQKKAFEEGLPYQTFISSLIHKFVTGKLIEK
ncbi:antitoxin [Leptospira levettii]|uniref:Antitoxin n=1 Tax=Leptospira levettii TaxID=2023178 RepID=A0A5F2AB95_9LEPT|nr:antitoxin [Leptospira levettii]MCW7465197.1 antitoxin [Leptospira levettii]MCW7496037.1 antitoxin [Leptospira levettii]MCW7509937.1 antitoxin [Leptospira levettii]MCW7513687.1 antitoxin [Leptospira levettii]TGL67769.1 antitoxin [Leptospira levettii]